MQSAQSSSCPATQRAHAESAGPGEVFTSPTPRLQTPPYLSPCSADSLMPEARWHGQEYLQITKVFRPFFPVKMIGNWTHKYLWVSSPQWLSSLFSLDLLRLSSPHPVWEWVTRDLGNLTVSAWVQLLSALTRMLFTPCKDRAGQCITCAAQANERREMVGVHLMPCNGRWGYWPLCCAWGAGWQRDQAIFWGHPGHFWSLYIPDPLQHTVHHRRFLQSLPRGFPAWLGVLGFPVWVAVSRCSSACATLSERCKHCRTLWPCLRCVWDLSRCWAVSSQGLVALERLRRLAGEIWGA